MKFLSMISIKLTLTVSLLGFLFLNFTFAGNVPDVSTTVSRENPLYDIEVKAKTKTHNSDIKNYQVKENNSLEEVFEKIIISERLMIKETNADTLSFYVSNCRLASKLFPGNAALISYYAYAIYYYQANPGTAEAITLLCPYIQELQSTPGISRNIWAILRHYLLNIHIVDTDPFMYKALDSKNKNDYEEKLTILCNYWASKIAPQYSTRWTDQAVNTATEKMANGGKEKALAIWQSFVKKMYATQVEYDAYDQRIIKNQIEAKAYNERKEAMLKKEDERFEKVLKTFDTLLIPPNPLEKIELLLSQNAIFRKKFKKYANIPNYGQLKLRYKNSNEAEILNIAFQSYILEDFEKCIKEINKMNNNNSDLRLLSVKVYCMQRLGYFGTALIVELNKILKIDPENRRVFMLKKMLEAQKEYQNIIIKP